MSSVRTLQTREQIILDHLPQVRSLAYPAAHAHPVPQRIGQRVSERLIERNGD
jgi:hypothetical protein